MSRELRQPLNFDGYSSNNSLSDDTIQTTQIEELKIELEEINKKIESLTTFDEEKQLNKLKGEISIYLNKTSSSFNKKMEKNITEAEAVIQKLNELDKPINDVKNILKKSILFTILILACLLVHIFSNAESFIGNVIGFIVLLLFIGYFVYQMRHW